MTRTTAALVVVGLGCPGLAAQEAKSPPTAVARPARVPAPKLAVAPPQAANDDALVAQFELQYAAQFRQLFRSELHVMRVATDASRPQYEKVVAEGDAVVKAAARAFAVGARNGGGGDADPRKAIADAVLKAVQTHLAPEQAAKYQKEVGLRAAARRRAIVANLVVLVDTAVVLSEDQRRQLAEVLAANWNEAWNQTQYFQNAGRFFPPMPDAKIRVILTDAQRAVWDGISKGNVRFGVNFNVPAWVESEDEVWPDDPPRKPGGPAAAKPGANKGGTP